MKFDKELTLLITIYNPTDDEINYWKEIYEKVLNSNIRMQWLVDNPEIDINKFKFIEKCDFFLNKLNKGKFWTVYNHIKKGNVTTNYYKICDPDDFIDLDNLGKLTLPKDVSVLNVPYYMINTEFGNKNFDYNEILNSSLEKVRKDTYGNYATIYPTGAILKDDFMSSMTDIKFHYLEDNLMGVIAFANGYNRNDLDCDPFYIYKNYNGISSPLNIEWISKEMPVTLKATFSIIDKIQRLPETESPFWIFDKLDYFIDFYESKMGELNNEVKGSLLNQRELYSNYRSKYKKGW